jgi:hypothetical protein
MHMNMNHTMHTRGWCMGITVVMYHTHD